MRSAFFGAAACAALCAAAGMTFAQSGAATNFLVKSVKQLIALAKARPGELNHASGGSGTGPHLAMEVFMQRTGIKVV
jgi:tripartite-type tricarboxylate transporter receptor subunit TctC